MRSCVSQDALQGQGCCGQEGGVGGWLQKVLEHEKPQDSALPLWPAPPHLPVGYWLQVLFLHLSGKLHLLVALAGEPQVSWTRGPKRCPLGGVAKGHSTHVTEGGAQGCAAEGGAARESERPLHLLPGESFILWVSAQYPVK